MRRTLALAILAALFCLSCSTPKVAHNPSVTARAAQTLAGHSAQVWQVAFSPDGRYLASCSVDKARYERAPPARQTLERGATVNSARRTRPFSTVVSQKHERRGNNPPASV